MVFKRAAAMIIAAAAPMTHAVALDYSLVEMQLPHCRPKCPYAIAASGTFSVNEHERFTQFVQRVEGRTDVSRTLLIHSSGGNTYGGMALGSVVRNYGFTVIVARPVGGGYRPGLCGSACVFTLAGGTRRFVPKGSAVAVHSARAIQPEFHDPVTGTVKSMTMAKGEIARGLGDYYASMGVSRGLADLGERVPNEQIRVLTVQELQRFRLTTARF